VTFALLQVFTAFVGDVSRNKMLMVDKDYKEINAASEVLPRVHIAMLF